LRQAYLLRKNPKDLLIVKNLEVYEGERHYTLVSLAGMLHDGERDAEEIVEILMEVQGHYFAGSKGEEEVRRIAEDVVRREPCRYAPRIYFGAKGRAW
jgi:hypothetical protein